MLAPLKNLTDRLHRSRELTDCFQQKSQKEINRQIITLEYIMSYQTKRNSVNQGNTNNGFMELGYCSTSPPPPLK